MILSKYDLNKILKTQTLVKNLISDCKENDDAAGFCVPKFGL